jgi:hypothetical protein
MPKKTSKLKPYLVYHREAGRGNTFAKQDTLRIEGRTVAAVTKAAKKLLKGRRITSVVVDPKHWEKRAKERAKARGTAR